MGVDGAEEGFAAVEALLADAFGEVEVADLEVFVRRVGTDGEGAVCGGEVAGVGELVGYLWDADVGREVFAGSEFVRDDGADGGILQGGGGAVAGEHVVGAALVGCFSVSHRADDGELVGNFGKLRDFFAKADSGESCLDGAEGAAIFGGGVGLRIEGLLMSHAAGEEDVDD